jgi:hypothetical protein
MNSLIDTDKHPRKLINREKELELVQIAFDTLIHKKNLLSTPIIDFFGIAGIGKTRILQEISAKCVENDLPCIKLDGSQNISRISSAVLQQTNKYRQKSSKKPTVRKSDSHAQTVNAIKVLLQYKPVVILLDSIDTSDVSLVNWIKITLRDLMEHNNLFIVLTSKQQIVFENDWFMARKLTPLQLKPLNRQDSTSYLDSLEGPISPKTREIIFRWTRGYPLAMEVMSKTLIEQHLDLEKSEDQQQLITLIIEEVIDKKVLAHVEPSRLDWYKAHLLLLSIPRRFNLIIMQELLEQFGSPLISKPQSKLEYMGLPKQLNANADVLYWDMQKAGFTIDESIRNIFFVYQKIHNFSLFIKIHQYLASKNMQIATEVAGSDSVRYFREYLYHSAQSLDPQAIEPILQPTLEQINKISPDAILQFSEEFTRDDQLQETLGEHHANVLLLMIQKYLHNEE